MIDGLPAADLPSLCSMARQLWPDKPALVFDETGQGVSFHDLDHLSDAYAGALAAASVKPGDRVGVMLPNRVEFPLLWLALAKLGAVLVPINVNYRIVDAGYVVAHSVTRLLVTTGDLGPLAQDLQRQIPTLETLACVDGGSDSVLDFRLDTIRLQRFAVRHAVLPETLLNIQYTSGTTGHPKGCMLTHYFWCRMGGNFVRYHPFLGENDITITCQPFYYADPQWLLVACLASGATMVVLDRFHSSTFWAKVREHGVTFFYCLGMMPAALFRTTASQAEREHRVRAVYCSAIPHELHAPLEERWGVPWYETYGMTETGGDVMMRPEDHDRLIGSGCIGRPLPDREVRIVDADDRPVPRQQIGQMVVRGPGLLDGYYRNQEATDTAFRNGWFHTGDLCLMTEDGLIYFVGREKDMIRRSGENIAALEVEEVIAMHPDVAEVACVAVPDEIRGEEVKAYVVIRAGAQAPHPEDLAAFCASRLASFKVPRFWCFRTSLPHTASERVAKGSLTNGGVAPSGRCYDRTGARWLDGD